MDNVVIIGGNERMECKYKEICKKHNCKAKIFTRMVGNLKTQIGQPDLIILLTSTVSHKMVHCALKEAERFGIPVERMHGASASALNSVLEDCCLKQCVEDCSVEDCPNKQQINVYENGRNRKKQYHYSV